MSGVTFTADITVSGDSYSNEMGFELNCNDGVHHIGYAQESGGFYGGWKSDRPNREHLRANRQHNIGPWLANVVFEQYAFCEVDIWDAYGDGWNGGVLTINLPVPKTYSMPCPSDMACNTQYKGPLRFTFLVDYASPAPPPPLPPQPPHAPPPPQGPGLDYPLGSAITGYSQNSGTWGLALNRAGSVLAVNVNLESGHARVYDYSSATSDWVQRGSNIEHEYGQASKDGYIWTPGHSMALSDDGNIVAIGGHANHGGAYEGREDSTFTGYTRVYQWDAANAAWVQMGQDIDGERAHDHHGIVVDLSSDGTILAVTGPMNRGLNNDNRNQGFVRVYRWEPDTTPDPWYDKTLNSWVGGDQPGAWVQIGQDIDGDNAGDGIDSNFGLSMALSADGNVLVVGAPNADSEGPLTTTAYSRADLGLARVYEWDPDTTPDPWHSHEAEGMVGGDQPGAWVKRGVDLDTGNHAEAKGTDRCGWSVASNHDGSLIAIGCRQYHWGGHSWDAGRVRTHMWNGNAYVQYGSDLVANSGDWFGYSMAMSHDGQTIVVGAPKRDGLNGNGATRTGAMMRYQWHNGDWEKRGETTAGAVAYQEVGYRVVLSGDGTVMGVSHQERGNVYMFGTPKYAPVSYTHLTLPTILLV